MTPALTAASEHLIALASVVTTHATRGELRLRLFNPTSTALATGSTVVLRRGNERQVHTVRTVRRHGVSLLVAFEGCESMSAAEALIGFEVCMRAQDLPPAGSDEIYHYELLGMTVVTTAGVEIGTVAEVMPVASSDICVVRDGQREYLIPLIADVVKQLNREQRRLVIDPLPGLLEP